MQKSRTAKVTPLKEAIDAMLTTFEKIGGEKFLTGKIRSLWSALMGAVIAKQTTDLVLKRGTLYIRITSPSLKHDLHMSRRMIKDKLNLKLGKDCIEEIFFV